MERAMLKQRKMRSPAWHSVHLLKKSCSPLSPSSRPFAGASAAMTFAVPTLVAKSKTESPVVMAVFKYPCAACVSSGIDCATRHASPRLRCKCLRHLFAGVTRWDGLLPSSSSSSSSSSSLKTQAQARGREVCTDSFPRLKNLTCMLAGQGFLVRGDFLPRTCRQRNTLLKQGAQEEPLRGILLPPRADQWQHGQVAGERRMACFQ
jgi:hypothetical protein